MMPSAISSENGNPILNFMKEVKNFAVLYGSAEIKNGSIFHTQEISKKNGDLPTKTKEVQPESEKGSEIRSDVYFYNGIIEFKAKFKDESCGCLMMFNSLDETGIGVGLSSNWKKFIVPNDTIYKTTGSLKNYDLSKDLQFKVEVYGSNINLFVNGVLISQGKCNIKNSPIAFRLSGPNVKLFDIKYEATKPKAFVVMQFSDEYNILYKDVIKPICESYGLECVRADEFFESTPILKDIVDSINLSSLIIAEITPDNPNVFYEIGYAHALNKPTIILCDKTRSKLPFDLSGFRTLFYENSIGGKNRVENDLQKYVEKIFKNSNI